MGPSDPNEFEGQAVAPAYHVFLAHNSQDKRLVSEIRVELAGEGIRGWLDENDGAFGERTSVALEKGIAASACCAFFVGGSGIGPWQEEEVERAVRNAVRQGKRFAAVLLPGYSGRVEDLPPGLDIRWPIDLRDLFSSNRLTDVGLELLVRQIRGAIESSRVAGGHDQPQASSAGRTPLTGPGTRQRQVQLNQQVALLFAAADPDASSLLRGPTEVPKLVAWLGKASLQDRVKHRTFTPFVGYGAVQSGPKTDDSSKADCLKWDSSFEPPNLTEWVQRNQSEFSRLGTLIERDLGAEDVVRFLDRVREQRADNRSLLTYDERRTQITALRFACLRLAHVATLVLVDAWHREPHPVSDWNVHDIALDIDGFEQVAAALDECVLRCLEVEVPGPAPELLGLPGLRLRLEATRSELASALSGTLVEWFTDVFWHVMTFDSDVYPRIGELATQVSLMMGSAEPRKHLIPISRVQRGDYKVLVDAVTKSLDRGVEPANSSAVRKAFLQKLAEVSHVMHAEWHERIWEAGAAKRTPRSTPQPSLLMTTTLGLDLEFALAGTEPRTKRSVYHVAVPVVVDYSLADVGRCVVVRWLVGDFRVAGSRADRAAVTRPESPWRWLHHWETGDNGLGFPELRGPLLLKLAGSPLHDTGNMRTIGVEERREFGDDREWMNDPDVLRVISPAVTLDEFDVIQRRAFELVEMGGQIGTGDRGTRILPQWLRQTIHSPGRWWIYLGPRLTDWNSRMEFVLNSIFMATRFRDPQATKPVLVGSNIRPDHTRILSLLDILPLDGDCFALTDSLGELARAIPMSLDAVVTGSG